MIKKKLAEIIKERVLSVAEYIIRTKNTIRQAAKVFGVSKSTIHKDLKERLKNFSLDLYDQVIAILDKNKAERYIRGGMATKKKWELMKSDGLMINMI